MTLDTPGDFTRWLARGVLLALRFGPAECASIRFLADWPHWAALGSTSIASLVDMLEEEGLARRRGDLSERRESECERLWRLQKRSANRRTPQRPTVLGYGLSDGDMRRLWEILPRWGGGARDFA
jgi:hypothetical protein